MEVSQEGSAMKVPSAARTRPGDLPRVLFAATIVAILDISFAATYWVVYKGTTTLPRILQSIATGIQGRAAMQGGTASVLLGAAAHCAVALGWTMIFWLAARRWPAFRRVLGSRGGAFRVGMPYGVFVWLAMEFVVVPISHAKPAPVLSAWFAVSLVWHAFGVGLPMAVILREPVSS